MSFKDYIYIIKSDLYRYKGETSFLCFLSILFKNVGFKYSFWMRTAAYLRSHISLRLFYIFVRLLSIRYTYKYGIDIQYNTNIGPGFYIGHFGGIIVNWHSTIGANCNITTGVVIGQSNRGDKKGCPVIGEKVFIGPGAKIFGNIKIGNSVAIGANSVITSDVPDNAVVVGAPGKVISYKGSESYINRVWF